MKPPAVPIILALLIPAAHAWAAPNDLDDLLRGGGIVLDHPPLNTGGLASDTLLIDMFNNEIWQRVADDIILGSAATIRRIGWWGFYNLDNPPVTETMRIRFYGAREGDGLPDDNDILFEESFLNPSRIATGRTVFTGVDPDEYIYQVNLTTAIQLDAATPYWLEIVQIGDIDTHFRWEVSQAEQNGQAFINPITVDWRHSLPSLTADTAFQLSIVPEPSALGLFLFSLMLVGKRRSRKEDLDKDPSN